MGALGFGLAGAGLVLIWAGVKGEDLREVLADVFSGRRRFKAAGTPQAQKEAAKAGASSGGGGWLSKAAADPQVAKEAAKGAGSTSATAPPGTVAP